MLIYGNSINPIHVHTNMFCLFNTITSMMEVPLIRKIIQLFQSIWDSSFSNFPVMYPMQLNSYSARPFHTKSDHGCRPPDREQTSERGKRVPPHLDGMPSTCRRCLVCFQHGGRRRAEWRCDVSIDYKQISMATRTRVHARIKVRSRARRTRACSSACSVDYGARMHVHIPIACVAKCE